ncbi:MAG: energy transducer TonB [Bacteroidia bacterium]|jgi:TonB family protein|nr:energy transducer TonB [Bacteroidia bacterium]
MIKYLLSAILSILLINRAYSQPLTNHDTIYKIVEILPEYKTGAKELQAFISRQAIYPLEAIKLRHEGIVDVHFIVAKDGKIREVKVIAGGKQTLEQEAARVIRLMPLWTPGRIRNKPVDTYYSLSILFMLKDSTVKLFTGEQTQPFIEPAVGQNDLAIEDKSSSMEVVNFAEQMPEFQGDIYKFLSNNLKYPSKEVELGIEGKVVISFIVMSDGSIIEPKVIKSAGKAFDTEALRVIMLMPNWKPGRMNGKPVNVKMNLPIVFKLK